MLIDLQNQNILFKIFYKSSLYKFYGLFFKKVLFFFVFCILIFNLGAKTYHFNNIKAEYAESDSKIVEEFLNRLDKRIDKLHRTLGVYPEQIFEIYIAQNEKDFSSIISKLNIKNPEFSEAFYSTNYNKMFARNPKNHKRFNRFENILLHEYIHHLIFIYWENAPLWFHEGMAVYFSEGMSLQNEMTLVQQMIYNKSIPLEDMRRKYPDRQLDRAVFYGKSCLAVKLMFNKHKSQFYSLWDNVKQKNDFYKDFRTSFSINLNTFEKEIDRETKNYSFSSLIFGIINGIWILMPILLFINWIKKKIQNKTQIDNWIVEDEIEKNINTVNQENDEKLIVEDFDKNSLD